MASMTSPEQGAQQECISTLLRPAGRSSLGRTSSDMADKTGKTVGAAGKPLFYDELAQGGPPTRPPRTAQPSTVVQSSRTAARSACNWSGATRAFSTPCSRIWCCTRRSVR